VFAGRRLRGVEGTAVARTCRRRAVTVECAQFADDEHVEDENDQRHDEEDGQFGHPWPDGPQQRAALATGQRRLHPQHALTGRSVVRPEVRLVVHNRTSSTSTSSTGHCGQSQPERTGTAFSRPRICRVSVPGIELHRNARFVAPNGPKRVKYVSCTSWRFVYSSYSAVFTSFAVYICHNIVRRILREAVRVECKFAWGIYDPKKNRGNSYLKAYLGPKNHTSTSNM